MKTVGKIKKKLKSKSGESITEVLVALLVSSLGLMILAGMISSSFRLISGSRNAVERYVDAQNELVERDDGGAEGTLRVSSDDFNRLTDDDETDINVYYYKNDVAGRPVISYGVKN